MILRSSKEGKVDLILLFFWKSGYMPCLHLNFTVIIKLKQSYMIKKSVSLYGRYTFSVVNGINANMNFIGRICR